MKPQKMFDSSFELNDPCPACGKAIFGRAEIEVEFSQPEYGKRTSSGRLTVSIPVKSKVLGLSIRHDCTSTATEAAAAVYAGAAIDALKETS